MADKDQTGIMAPLLPLVHALYLTRPEYFRSATTATLAEKTKGFKGEVMTLEKIPEAIEAAGKNAGPKDLVVVTGSLFTVGEARAHLTGEPMGNRI
jgi:dihydrofolate synthase/folylpolyglutamate synthase